MKVRRARRWQRWRWRQRSASATAAPLLTLAIVLIARAPMAQESGGAAPELARDCTALFSALAAKEPAELVTLGRIEPRAAVAQVDGAPLTLCLDVEAKEVMFAAVDGAITVFDVASGERRRGVTPGRKREGEPTAFLVDSRLRHIALADGRDVQVLTYPELDRIAEFRMEGDLELAAGSGDFFGAGALAVIGAASLRVANEKGIALSKVEGEPVELCGHPDESVVFVWLAMPAAKATGEGEGEGSDAEADAAAGATEWRPTRFKHEGKRMKVDATGAAIAAPGADCSVMWSGDARACLLIEGSSMRVFATRELKQVASGELVLAEGERIGGLTPHGGFVVVHGVNGEIRAHRAVDGFPAAGALRPKVSRGFKAAGFDLERLRYHARGDRFVAVSEAGDVIFVLGPPGARAP